MTKETQIALAKAVQELRVASGPAWDMFLKALTLHLDEVTENCIHAPPDRLPESQGRAREIRDLFKALVSSPQLAAQMAEKERRDANTRR
jgi:hypothetical protein